MKKPLAVLVAVLLSTPTFAAPKLTVMLVIDQFRADYLLRFQKRFMAAGGADGKVGGFRFLMEKGAYYPDAQYDIMQSMTGPGHATVLSGSYPYQNGIVGNEWYDPKTGQIEYCVEDPTTPTVGATPKSTHIGTSPRNFNGSTVGDEIKNAGHASKVISIALKDRAAILMGGYRADLAVWMDFASYHWVSSKHYLPDGKLPAWIEDENKKVAERSGSTYTWKTLGPETSLTQPDPFTFGDEFKKAYGVKFPHEAKVGNRSSAGMPIGLEETLSMAERAI
ncbi:MAG TPA: alkaline phosphatase family protein, partial [Bdellovibrionota bacterium]|nr:alkaline phosphatase family protein [Bdellovibrionota bacterium]